MFISNFSCLKKILSCINLSASCHLSKLYNMCEKIECFENKLDLQQLKNDLEPPIGVSGMKVLDREKFNKNIEVPSVSVTVDKIKLAIKQFKPYFLKMRQLQPVMDVNNNKLLLLNPILVNQDFQKIYNMLKDLSLNNLSMTKVSLKYDNWNHESVFKAVLPLEFEGVSSFSIVGHIIHLNLKPHLLDYKYLIGQVLLDKFSNVKTVVNKTQEIGSEYRNFIMEVLAGEPNFSATVKENGHKYTFDFSKVFWNPRLVNEHDQIVKKFNSGDVVYDVFAGVGPFSIPAAKKKCHVYANDLNPDSYHWLCHNSKLNKVGEYLTAYNLDGRDFICNVIKNGLIEWDSKLDESSKIHIVMNLPASAIEFISSFKNMMSKKSFTQFKNMPIVYCYCFLKKDEEISEVVSKYFDETLKKDLVTTPVRNVAPNKTMLRIEFTMTEDYLFSLNEEPQTKKIKLYSEH